MVEDMNRYTVEDLYRRLNLCDDNDLFNLCNKKDLCPGEYL